MHIHFFCMEYDLYVNMRDLTKNRADVLYPYCLMFCRNHHLWMFFMFCMYTSVNEKKKIFGSCSMSQTWIIKQKACGLCFCIADEWSITVCSRRLSTHWKAPSCRQLSSHASIDVISGPISLPPIGPLIVTLLSYLTCS